MPVTVTTGVASRCVVEFLDTVRVSWFDYAAESSGIAITSGLLFWFVSWLVKRPRTAALEATVAGIALVFGVYCAVTVTTRGSAAGVANWGLWLVPSVADTALAIVFLILQAVTKARRRRATPSPEPLEPVGRAIEKLTPSEQQAVRSDVDGAIAGLAARGSITPDVAATARRAPLGKLGLYMSGGAPRETVPETK